MPEQIRCPSCDATLRVPENLLGKNVKCPKCQKTFLAELDAPAEPEEMIEEPPPPKARRRPSLPEDDEGIVDEPTPKSRRRPAPPEDEEDEPPPEDEDEDRPRRRKRRRGGRSSVAVESSLSGPAIALMVVGGIDIFLGVLNFLAPVLGFSLMAAGSAGPGKAAGNADFMANMVSGVIQGLLNLVFGGVIILGAMKMKQVQSYGLAMTSCIMAMIPCVNCCILGLPFGIWGIVVLNKPEVKEAFS